MSFLKKLTILSLATVLLVSTASLVEAKSSLKGKITLNGSTALLPLSLQAAKEFKKLNPGVSIAASGKGSVTGPQSVKKGIAQIGACDWDASMDVPGFKAFEGQVANKVAVIPFAAIVNKNVTVSNLTTAQLQGIFTGKITNWKDVGGADADIVVINRSFGSGTRVNFIAKALDGTNTVDRATNYKLVGSSGDMKNGVATTPNSIGYLDLAFVIPDFKTISINGIAPTIDNVISGKYKVWAYGYYMTKGPATGVTKAFIDFVQSKDFQQGSLKKMKYIPVAAMK
jgi:phosphate transport system substrate-binding protein